MPEHVCSFCSKSDSDGRIMILGPAGVNICNECTKMCWNLLCAKEKEDEHAVPPTESEDNLYCD